MKTLKQKKSKDFFSNLACKPNISIFILVTVNVLILKISRMFFKPFFANLPGKEDIK